GKNAHPNSVVTILLPVPEPAQSPPAWIRAWSQRQRVGPSERPGASQPGSKIERHSPELQTRLKLPLQPVEARQLDFALLRLRLRWWWWSLLWRGGGEPHPKQDSCSEPD